MVENVGALTSAIELLNKESDSLVTNFGRLADTSKTWNIISRLLSGSGLWQLQNRIRAIGNVVNLYNINLAKSLEKQMDNITSAKKMSETIADLKAEQTSLMNSEYFDALEKGLIAQGYDEATASLMAHMEITQKYDNAITALEKKQEKIGSGGIGKIAAFMRHGDTQSVDPETGEKKMKEGDTGMLAFSRQASENQRLAAIYYYQSIKKYFTEKKFLETASRVNTWFRGKIRTIGRFLDVGLTLFGAFLKYLLIATLVVFLLKQIWPSFKEMLKAVGGLKFAFETLLSGLKDILYGVFNIFAGVFQGDFRRVFKGLGLLLQGLGKVVLGALVGLGQILIAALFALPLKIGKAVKRGILGRATGGPASGLTVVGERGPELLNLPAGSRVHSNSASRGMAGNTINVHVNGRVGASDAEIRDIANKVAREINMRMNRTTSAVSRF